MVIRFVDESLKKCDLCDRDCEIIDTMLEKGRRCLDHAPEYWITAANKGLDLRAENNEPEKKAIIKHKKKRGGNSETMIDYK